MLLLRPQQMITFFREGSNNDYSLHNYRKSSVTKLTTYRKIVANLRDIFKLTNQF